MKTFALIALVASNLSTAAFAASGDAFECKGKTSGNFYDLDITDVGNEEGEVVANNGGAPQNFPAEYRDVGGADTVVHRFIFGFELFNNGTNPQLSVITIKPRGGSAWTGKAEYFEHDSDSQSHRLIKEKITCTKVK